VPTAPDLDFSPSRLGGKSNGHAPAETLDVKQAVVIVGVLLALALSNRALPAPAPAAPDPSSPAPATAPPLAVTSVNTPQPIATPRPNVAQTRTAVALWVESIPTSTPVIPPGALLYETGWGTGRIGGWNTGDEWEVEPGALISKETSSGTILAPYSIPVANYAIEVVIENIDSSDNQVGGRESYGIVARSDTRGLDGFFAGRLGGGYVLRGVCCP
jgi:hypothetical protein